MSTQVQPNNGKDSCTLKIMIKFAFDIYWNILATMGEKEGDQIYMPIGLSRENFPSMGPCFISITPDQ